MLLGMFLPFLLGGLLLLQTLGVSQTAATRPSKDRGHYDGDPPDYLPDAQYQPPSPPIAASTSGPLVTESQMGRLAGQFLDALEINLSPRRFNLALANAIEGSRAEEESELVAPSGNQDEEGQNDGLENDIEEEYSDEEYSDEEYSQEEYSEEDEYNGEEHDHIAQDNPEPPPTSRIERDGPETPSPPRRRPSKRRKLKGDSISIQVEVGSRYSRSHQQEAYVNDGPLLSGFDEGPTSLNVNWDHQDIRWGQVNDANSEAGSRQSRSLAGFLPGALMLGDLPAPGPVSHPPPTTIGQDPQAFDISNGDFPQQGAHGVHNPPPNRFATNRNAFSLENIPSDPFSDANAHPPPHLPPVPSVDTNLDHPSNTPTMNVPRSVVGNLNPYQAQLGSGTPGSQARGVSQNVEEFRFDPSASIDQNIRNLAQLQLHYTQPYPGGFPTSPSSEDTNIMNTLFDDINNGNTLLGSPQVVHGLTTRAYDLRVAYIVEALWYAIELIQTDLTGDLCYALRSGDYDLAAVIAEELLDGDRFAHVYVEGSSVHPPEAVAQVEDWERRRQTAYASGSHIRSEIPPLSYPADQGESQRGDSPSPERSSEAAEGAYLLHFVSPLVRAMVYRLLSMFSYRVSMDFGGPPEPGAKKKPATASSSKPKKERKPRRTMDYGWIALATSLLRTALERYLPGYGAIMTLLFGDSSHHERIAQGINLQHVWTSSLIRGIYTETDEYWSIWAFLNSVRSQVRIRVGRGHRYQRRRIQNPLVYNRNNHFAALEATAPTSASISAPLLPPASHQAQTSSRPDPVVAQVIRQSTSLLSPHPGIAPPTRSGPGIQERHTRLRDSGGQRSISLASRSGSATSLQQPRPQRSRPRSGQSGVRRSTSTPGLVSARQPLVGQPEQVVQMRSTEAGRGWAARDEPLAAHQAAQATSSQQQQPEEDKGKGKGKGKDKDKARGKGEVQQENPIPSVVYIDTPTFAEVQLANQELRRAQMAASRDHRRNQLDRLGPNSMPGTSASAPVDDNNLAMHNVLRTLQPHIPGLQATLDDRGLALWIPIPRDEDASGQVRVVKLYYDFEQA